MADGRKCRRCGYQESEHLEADSMRYAIPSRMEEAVKEYPGICIFFCDPREFKKKDVCLDKDMFYEHLLKARNN